MWFQDWLAPITSALDCDDKTGLAVLRLALDAHDRGNNGLPFSDKINGADEYNDGHEIRKAFASGPLANGALADTDDAASLVYDAWKEGIQRKDRVTVRLVKCSEDVCECGSCVASGAEVCPDCGSKCINRQYYAEVWDDFAGLWADSDQYIDGSSWESADGPDFVYTILYARSGLITELQAEGYILDLSEYDEADEQIAAE